MSDIARRVIEVTPDQVIGPPRRRKRVRVARLDPTAANWLPINPTWETPPNAPTQQGFGHMDRIAREKKA